MQNQDFIICVSHTPWGGGYQKAVVQLMTELAVRHRVLFVDYQYTIKDWVFGLFGREKVPLREVLRLKNPLSKKTLANGGELYVWVPPMALVVNWMPDFLARLLHEVERQLAAEEPAESDAYNRRGSPAHH